MTIEEQDAAVLDYYRGEASGDRGNVLVHRLRGLGIKQIQAARRRLAREGRLELRDGRWGLPLPAPETTTPKATLRQIALPRIGLPDPPEVPDAA